jgi:regulator of sirC expression with transglutaminase-like and TPR domain
MLTQEIRRILAEAGAAPADGMALAETALALAAIDRPRVALARYRAHLDEVGGEVAEGAAGAAPGDAAEAAAALARTLAGRHGYEGDEKTYEDLQNANLMRVIDRRRGLPVALGILYIHAARRQGWTMRGLRFPGHFLIRLDLAGERVILDPFHGGRTVAPSDLRDMLKAMSGGGAELAPDHYAAVSDRDILLRLQNNVKLRQLRADDAVGAARTLQAMRLIAPAEPELGRELGLLQARLGNLGAAIAALESYLASGADDRLRHQTAIVLQQIRNRLN